MEEEIKEMETVETEEVIDTEPEEVELCEFAEAENSDSMKYFVYAGLALAAVGTAVGVTAGKVIKKIREKKAENELVEVDEEGNPLKKPKDHKINIPKIHFQSPVVFEKEKK